MQRLLLIDGNAIMHRAFHALPPLTNLKGEGVNAVYGFFSMLFTVMGEMKPTHLVVCFDRPKPTFRQALFVGYQQHRPKMDESLVGQFVLVHRILEAMKVVVFEVDGYEADDLIGTISTQMIGRRGPASRSSQGAPASLASAANADARLGNSSLASPLSSLDLEVVILSGDRDLLQLVNHSVKMLAPVVGVKNTILYDSEKVGEKFGVRPEQIVDYKALVGDASDGYAGVAGVGPKTASGLLQKYETLEGVYAHLGELEGKLREKLAKGSEEAALCKRLATIVRDAPISFRLEESEVGRWDIEGLRGAFAEQGFKSLGKRVEKEFPISNVKFPMSNGGQEEGEQLGLLGES